MKIENYKNWQEVISIEEFESYINELVIKQKSFSNSILLEIVTLLSEKYLLFYGLCKLTLEQKIEINKILINLTDFSSLEITEDLIGVLFNFRLDNYYSFLKEEYKAIKLDEVRREVIDALNEYEKIGNVGRVP